MLRLRYLLIALGVGVLAPMLLAAQPPVSVPAAPCVLVVDGVEMAPLLPLAELLQASLIEDMRTGAVTFKRKGRSFTCTAGVRTATARGRALNLPCPPFMHTGVLYTPVAALAQAMGGKVMPDAGQHTLTLTMSGVTLALPCDLITDLQQYSNDSEHYLLNPDGSGLHRLTYDGWTDNALSMSPDGRFFVFLGRNSLRIRAVDSPVVRVLQAGETPVEYASPSCSPDGEWILFSEFVPTPDGGWQICRIRPDGTEKRVLGKGTDPRYSPDGTQIVYGVLTQNGPVSESMVGLMNADGSDARVIGPGGAPFAFSPDGAYLLFHRFINSPANLGAYQRPMRYALATGDILPADPLAGFAHSHRGWGVFSPDGAQIVYADNNALVVARNDLTGARELTPDQLRADRVTSPQFTPDGKAIFYLQQDQLYRIALDGTAPVLLAGRLFVDAFTLTPDGRHLLLLATPHPMR